MKKIVLLASFSLTVVLTGCLTDDIPEPVSFNDQLQTDIALINDFLSDNDIVADVHQSGIRYVVTDEGDGEVAEIGDRIAMKFTATALSGKVYLQDTIGFTIDLNSPYVDAWLLMFPEIMEGGSITAYSPSGYAYGPSGNSVVPKNENLIFELELLEIINSEEEQFAREEAIIDEFLTESGINFQVHSSGIRYTLIEEGDGELPLIEDFVSVTFVGTYLNGDVFDASGIPISLSLKNLIESWQIMLQETKVGSTIKFYSPSVYCYGVDGSLSANILPNTTLVFEITLEGIN